MARGLSDVVDLVRTIRVTARLRLRGVAAGTVVVHGVAPRFPLRGKVRLGRRVIFRGVSMRSEIGALRGGALRLDDGVFINQGCTVVSRCRITIGADTMLGDRVAVYDTSFHPLDSATPTAYEPVVIGRNVWLGTGVIVLPGSVIGDGAVVGAGSLVSGEIPARTLAIGQPAKVVRELQIDEGWVRADIED